MPLCANYTVAQLSQEIFLGPETRDRIFTKFVGLQRTYLYERDINHHFDLCCFLTEWPRCSCDHEWMNVLHQPVVLDWEGMPNSAKLYTTGKNMEYLESAIKTLVFDLLEMAGHKPQTSIAM